MDDNLIECPPTKEWLAQHEGNTQVSGGRMATKVAQLRYRTVFDLVADPDLDILHHDYSSTFQHFEACRYAYLITQRATAGWRADTAGAGTSDQLPLADLYIKLMLRFSQLDKALRAQGVNGDDHWTILMMLATPITEGFNIERTRSAMYPLVHHINAALCRLEDFMLEVQKLK